MKKLTTPVVIFFKVLASIYENLKKKPDIAHKEELLESFKNQDWAELRVILIAHTIKRLVYRYGIKKKPIALKDDADIILSDVLSAIVLEDRRNWNKNEYATFQDFVISVIDSDLSNKFKKSQQNWEEISDSVTHSTELSQEERLLYLEKKDIAFNYLEELGAQDDELMVFECMSDGITKPIHIKNELGLQDNEFRNIWRRLNPRMKELRKKMSNHG